MLLIFSDLCNDSEYIRREVTVDDWFDTRYLKASLKKQGLENYWAPSDANGRSRSSQPSSFKPLLR